MSKNDEVLKLVNGINNNRITLKMAEKAICSIENKYGDFNIPYDVDDRMDNEYFKELNNDAHIGIYSKESILKMASIMDERSKRRIKHIIICVSSIVAVLIALLTIIIFISKR